jgi:hypothetical protein
MRTRSLLMAIVLLAPAPAFAQASASYRLDEHSLNAGGRPAQAIVAASPTYRITLDAIGEPVAGRGPGAPSYRLDGGFSAAYAPPGEVDGLRVLVDTETLVWSREPAATAYNIYSGPLATLPGSFGVCAVSQVADTSWADASSPAVGEGLFYLVTGRNRLREEGTKGRTSSGAERANPAPCP